MSRHFCFCIPVRAGVFLFSLFSFLLTAAMAGIAWYATYKVHHDPGQYTDVTEKGKIIVIVVGSVFTFMALISLFGFIGSITRNRRFVKAYSVMSWIVFFLSLASSGFLLYVVYAGKELVHQCVSVDANGNVNTGVSCDFKFSTTTKIVVTVIVALELLVHLYIVAVIRRYVEQLDDASWKGQYTLTSTDVRQGLLNPVSGPYPYSDGAHSYGNHA